MSGTLGGDLDSAYRHFGKLHESLGIELTMRCPLSCAHCSYESGPDRAEKVDEQALLRFVSGAVDDGDVKLLILSGGEPFLEPGLVRRIARIAAAADVYVTVNTSAYWAKTPERALAVLGGFDGVTHLNVSTDEYHEEFLSLSHARNAVCAALDLGIVPTLMIRVWDVDRDPFLLKVEKEFGRALLDRIAIDLQAIVPEGRGRHLLSGRKVLRRHAREFPLGACDLANQPNIDACSTVVGCCNHNVAIRHKALQLGNIESDTYSEVKARGERNHILQAIRVWGPGELAKRLVAAGYGDELSGSYPEGSICALCEEIVSNARLVSALEAYFSDPRVYAELYLSRLCSRGEIPMLEPDAGGGCRAL